MRHADWPCMSMSMDAFFALLKAQKHTGAVTIHLSQGTPSRVDIPSEPQRISFDKGQGKERHLTS